MVKIGASLEIALLVTCHPFNVQITALMTIQLIKPNSVSSLSIEDVWSQ